MCTGGCGTVGSKISRIVSSPEQERNLAAALDSLRAGREQQARDMFEHVIVAPPLGGVTDEALFRLALLHVGDDGGKDTTRARSLLERLRNDYPNSPWTRQSAPLAAYLAGAGNPRDREREIRTLRQLNLSLSRDNKELRQSIERLKSLDLELEQKMRR